MICSGTSLGLSALYKFRTTLKSLHLSCDSCIHINADDSPAIFSEYGGLYNYVSHFPRLEKLSINCSNGLTTINLPLLLDHRNSSKYLKDVSIWNQCKFETAARTTTHNTRITIMENLEINYIELDDNTLLYIMNNMKIKQNLSILPYFDEASIVTTTLNNNMDISTLFQYFKDYCNNSRRHIENTKIHLRNGDDIFLFGAIEESYAGREDEEE